jgi:hypothetical protein
VDDLTNVTTTALAKRSSRRTFLKLSGTTALGVGVWLTGAKVALGSITACSGCGGCPGADCVAGNPQTCDQAGKPCPDCFHGGGCPGGCTGIFCWYCCIGTCRRRCCECTCPNGVCCYCFTDVQQLCSGAAAPDACACV